MLKLKYWVDKVEERGGGQDKLERMGAQSNDISAGNILDSKSHLGKIGTISFDNYIVPENFRAQQFL